MKKTDARVRYTKRVLKETLLKLLSKKPINKITVKEVCELADLNRATFYSHYSDCFALLDSIEDELVEAFMQAIARVRAMDVSTVIEAIYGIIESHSEACRVLIFQDPGSRVIRRMIDSAREDSIAFWRKELPKASDEDLELLYIHLSHGLMHVVVDGYGRYDKETIVSFVNCIVRRSLSGFDRTQAGR